MLSMGKISKAFALFLTVIIALSCLTLLTVKTANAIPTISLPEITILSNGSIQTSNGSIQRSLSPSAIINEGNIYVITENISDFWIDIKCSNILLLGEGNTLQTSFFNNGNSGVAIEANGVTVQNVSISGFFAGVDVKGSSNKIIGCNIRAYTNYGISVEGQSNLITENLLKDGGNSGIELFGSFNTVNANTINSIDGDGVVVDEGSNNNIVSRNLLNTQTFDIQMFGNSNSIIDNTITSDGSHGIIFYDPAKANIVKENDIINNWEGLGLDTQANTIYLNNFVNNTYNVRLHYFNDTYPPYSMNAFDNGSVGNYWSDYTAKYPNAQEIDSSGIYNIPYVILGTIVDNYPLTTPSTIGSTGIQLPTGSPNPTSSPSPTPIPTETPNLPRNPPHLDPIYYLIPVSVIVVAVMLSVLLFRRHRKTVVSSRNQKRN
jgi:nitrous oxidase accessory protein